MIILIIVVGIIVLLILGHHRKQQLRRFEELADAAIAHHKPTLLIKVQQLTKFDDYGNADHRDWSNHLAYFWTNVVLRDAAAAGLNTKWLNKSTVYEEFHKKLHAQLIADIKDGVSLDMSSVKTGIDYELFCRSVLEGDNWYVQTTPTTGDQGADLIAVKNGIRVVIQCKFYGQPVGNKAVQEAHAAKAFQRAQFAAVVTNATYTPSARALAQTSGVLLCHHDDLKNLNEKLGN